MTLFYTHDQPRKRAKKSTAITRFLVLAFRLITLALSPLIAVWMKLIVRDRGEKLKSEIQHGVDSLEPSPRNDHGSFGKSEAAYIHRASLSNVSHMDSHGVLSRRPGLLGKGRPCMQC